MDLVAGALIGIVYSAAPGPVNLVTIRRGLDEGPRAAMTVQCGSCLVDFAYAVAGLLGLGLVNMGPASHGALSIVGMSVLIWLGWSALVEGWQGLRRVKQASARIGNVDNRREPRYRRELWMGAALTLTDPLVPIFWISVASTALHRVGGSEAQFLSGFFLSVMLWGLALALVSGWRQLALRGQPVAWVSLVCGLGLLGSGLDLGRMLLVSLA